MFQNQLKRLSTQLDKSVKVNRLRDAFGLAQMKLRRNLWPCLDKKYLVVGSESSGTTVISHLLLRHGAKRFLHESANPWVYDLYQSVYQGQRNVRDYPQLQLFDCLKVPGFATVLPEYVKEFPNATVIYTVRDPRDVVASAYRTKKVTTRDEFASVSWVKETWLGIEEKDPVARLAIRWRTYLRKSLLVPGVTYVRYEDFCANKVEIISSLASSLDIEIDEVHLRENCDRQASDSDARAYLPKGPGSWQHEYLSEQDVRIIQDICGAEMQKWNYPLAAIDGNADWRASAGKHEFQS